MAEPTFSVIIPVYNASGTLGDAVQSVVEQSLPDIEILIIDDFSMDDSYDEAVAWRKVDDRVRVFRLPKNSGGPILPRNIGMEQATGRYVAFLDDDDLWFPEKLKIQLEKHKERPFALTYSRCRIKAPADSAIDGSDYHEWWRLTPCEGVEIATLTRQNFVPLSTVTLDRHWAHRVGSFRGVNGAEDWHYWIRVAAHGGAFGFVDEQLAVYSWTAANLSHQSAVPAVTRKTRTLQALADEFPEYRPLFVAEERQVRRRTTELRLRRLPAGVRKFASLAILPPRLWPR